MSVVSFPLRLPADLKDAAARQAEEAGMSLNQFIAVMLAARVGAAAEAERYFRARAARTKRGRAKDILKRLGTQNNPRRDDRLDAGDEE